MQFTLLVKPADKKQYFYLKEVTSLQISHFCVHMEQFEIASHIQKTNLMVPFYG